MYVAFLYNVPPFSLCHHCRSQTIVPFAYTAFSYLLCDLLSMYHAFCLGKGLPMGSGGSLLRFVRSKLFMVVHHLVLVVVGYPLAVVGLCARVSCLLSTGSPSACSAPQHDWMRKGMGDFLVGTLFVRELSSPLVAAAKVMRRVCAPFACHVMAALSRSSPSPLLPLLPQLRLEDTSLYQLNGGVLVVVFFLARIANTPLTLLFYAAQHHNWSLLNAFSSMRLICHAFLAAELALQLYWFIQILRAALKRIYRF